MLPRVRFPALFFVFLSSALPDVRQCACDAARPETMEARECGLCREAEKQTGGEPVFFLKDINPRKPNRMLALPRAHGKAQHSLHLLPQAEQARLWTAAIAKARELWGDEWGLAMNGDESRTQCHAHIHIGKLLKGVETAKYVVVKGPERIPAPSDGSGVWVHPEGGKLHVHTAEQITETVLLR
jgi:diadenosine tetraphosphate (Ap4A) HIT family hydrolase